ncbi:hypothetical protein RND71_040340 [Anisodus tanguticus]|uniref:Uncharacterized protein n=1 Tax=Anisodus tanguticus TaxID=243964 RepID=A0AAE1QSN3_9SOLA|nr:hypothetical protein RND71_040340 [Anisodus tanguticus]
MRSIYPSDPIGYQHEGLTQPLFLSVEPTMINHIDAEAKETPKRCPRLCEKSPNEWQPQKYTRPASTSQPPNRKTRRGDPSPTTFHGEEIERNIERNLCTQEIETIEHALTWGAIGLGTTNKFSARKNQDMNFYVSPRVEPEFHTGSYNGDNCGMPDKSTMVMEVYTELLDDAGRRTQYVKYIYANPLRESIIRGENKDYDCLFGPKKKNEENEYGSGDHDFRQPDFDVHESEDANEYVTQHRGKDSLLANLAETEKQSELAARVSIWKQN